MTTKLQQYITRENIHLLGIIVLLTGFPLSRSLMTIGQIVLLANWLFDFNILHKFKKALSDKRVLAFLGIILIHFVGLIYTDNFEYAYKDIRVKIPLLYLPLIFATTPPLSSHRWRFVFKVFGLAILLGSFISMYILFERGLSEMRSIRDISSIISHIRFSLFICLTIFIFIYMAVFTTKYDKYFRYWSIPVIIWLVVFLIILRSLTGYVVFTAGVFLMGLYYMTLIRHKILRLFLMMTILGITLIVVSFVIHSWARYSYRIEPVAEELPEFTSSGNPYTHKLSIDLYENSHFVYSHISEKELRGEWNKVSDYKYKGKDKLGHQLKKTLIRYLASKGLTKDSVGVSKLTGEDIRAIEGGIANYIYVEKYNLYSTLYRVFWELERYKKGANPSGYSIIQRFYYLEAGWNVFLKNPVIGVGTGDVKKEFNQYYRESNSVLTKRWRLRAHNQFLTIMVTFGSIGFIIFMTGIFYPVGYQIAKGKFNMPMAIFLGIALLSMLNEDTLETQAGALFFTFFYAFFYWGINEPPIPRRKNR